MHEEVLRAFSHIPSISSIDCLVEKILPILESRLKAVSSLKCGNSFFLSLLHLFSI
jgi:hypothetical protein